MRRVRAATRQAMAAFLLTIHLAACTSWRTESVTPAELIERDHPNKARVTTAAGNEMVLSHPFVDGDSLREGKIKKDAPTGIALQDIHQVATRGFSAGKTLALGAGVTLVGLGVGAVIGLASYDGITFGY